MGIYKRGDVYWYKFMFDGKLVRESTKQRNNTVARNMESGHRARLAKEKKERDAACDHLNCPDVLRCHECEKLFNAEKAIRKLSNIFCTTKCSGDWEKKHSMPTLRTFLQNTFVPFAKTRHKAKPRTVRYYTQGSDMLLRSKFGDLRLDDLTDKHAQEFEEQNSGLSASGINRGLRTLRRALNLAYKWGTLDKPVKIALAKGENQRDRVLSEEESEKYLAACPQPMRDIATIILDEGFRPGEVYALRWPHVLLNEDGTGLIQIVDGKSKAARRILPMTPRVYALLKARHEAIGSPEDGWIFPSVSANWTFKDGRSKKDAHFNDDSAKQQHDKAVTDSGVKKFVIYTLRHTGLTRLGEAAHGDVFVLAKIAGHSSITVTQRYIHPQAAAIDRVFANRKATQLVLGTKLGTVGKAQKKGAAMVAKEAAVTIVSRKA